VERLLDLPEAVKAAMGEDWRFIGYEVSEQLAVIPRQYDVIDSKRAKYVPVHDEVAGAETSALLYSLIETAKACGLEPWAYLNHLFEHLPAAKTPEAVEALLPHNLKMDDLKQEGSSRSLPGRLRRTGTLRDSRYESSLIQTSKRGQAQESKGLDLIF
jgi:hypothetical protein